ncbi:MAG: hypothetical protein HYZ50_10055 [Deltaproteobacteria bacterium]|nr:hypothetical protein [Deltaproteobacteria bacterium]
MKTQVLHGLVFLGLVLLAPSQSKAIDIPGIPDAGKAVAGTVAPAPTAGVAILSPKGEWSTFASMEGSGEPIFLITGRVKNTSGKPLSYVKMQFELLDKDGVVLLRDYGYNRKAEALREEAYESGKKALKDMELEELPTEAEDGFRFLFFQVDIPPFHSYRIRVLEGR